MAHKLIVGQTLSGKSTLAKKMVEDAIKRGIVPVIYDPTLSEWGCELVTEDEEEFFRTLQIVHNEGLPMFPVVDEADTLLSMAHRHNWWLFTRGRHFGMECCAITQRPKMIAPTVRTNAPELYVFHIGRSDAADLAEDFGAAGIVAAPDLRQGEFLRAIWLNGEKIVDKHRVF